MKLSGLFFAFLTPLAIKFFQQTSPFNFPLAKVFNNLLFVGAGIIQWTLLNGVNIIKVSVNENFSTLLNFVFFGFFA